MTQKLMNMYRIQPTVPVKVQAGLFSIAIAALAFAGCYSSASNGSEFGQQPPQVLPVITVSSVPATTYQEFSASLQGSKDIEIRPQVDGYLDKIFIDEGAYVKK